VRLDAFQNIFASGARRDGSSEPGTAQSGAARIVQATGDLPAMPHIAAQVVEKLSDPNASSRDIQQLIAQDQALAARVLKVANSAYYGASRSISTLRDAVLFMGFDSIKTVVLTAVMNGVFAQTGLAQKLLWEHATGCGLAARELGAAVRYSGREEAFLAGLMHDVGKAVLFLRVPDKMSRIMQEAYNGGADFAASEMETLGFTHADVGQMLADKWRFALNIEEAIANHHHPEKSQTAPQLTHIVSLANSVCHRLEIGPTRKPGLDLFELESAKALGLSAAEIHELAEKIRNAFRNGGEAGG
jgi:HD-like signal output (HDOD) protein